MIGDEAGWVGGWVSIDTMFILGRDRAILRKRETIDLAAAAFSIAVSPQAMFISLACTGTSSCARTRDDVLRVCVSWVVLCCVVCGAAIDCDDEWRTRVP